MCSLIRALDLSFWKRKHKRVAENVCLSGPQLSEERKGWGTSLELGVEKEGVSHVPVCMYSEFSFLNQQHACNFQMEKCIGYSVLATFWNQSLQMIMQKAKKNSLIKPSSSGSMFTECPSRVLGLMRIYWEGRVKTPLCLEAWWQVILGWRFHVTSGEVVSTIRRAQKALWIWLFLSYVFF